MKISKGPFFIIMRIKDPLAILLILIPLITFSQKMEFRKLRKNFGFANEGDTVKILYEFKNTGNKPLIITDYVVECGCTKLHTPAGPIQPGKSDSLLVTFDTHNKYDRQDRTVKVISNAMNSPVILRFKGIIKKPKKRS